MAWEGSDRLSRLPPDWKAIRQRILRRDHRMCQWIDSNELPCLEPATDVDHIVAGDDHSEANLRSLCRRHHAKKSSSEGGLAAKENRAQIRKRFRREEDHPGLL